MSRLANPEFMRRAIALATQNADTGGGGPFAAVVVRQGQIVGEGVNTVTTAHDPTAHGEVNAIRAGFDDAFLYEEFRKEQPARALPATQLLGDEAWASFAAWIASANKIKY